MQWLQSMVHDLAAHCPLNRTELCIPVSPVVLLLAVFWGVYHCIPQFFCVWQILNWTGYLPSETKVSVVMTMCLCVSHVRFQLVLLSSCHCSAWHVYLQVCGSRAVALCCPWFTCRSTHHRFPQMFEYLNFNPKDDMYYEADLFPEPDG